MFPIFKKDKIYCISELFKMLLYMIIIYFMVNNVKTYRYFYFNPMHHKFSKLSKRNTLLFSAKKFSFLWSLPFNRNFTGWTKSLSFNFTFNNIFYFFTKPYCIDNLCFMQWFIYKIISQIEMSMKVRSSSKVSKLNLT